MSLAIGQMKRCGRCKEHKHVSEFAKNRARPDGYSNTCRECRIRTPMRVNADWVIDRLEETGTTSHYTAGEMWDYAWSTSQLVNAVNWWREGVSYQDMAARFSREEVEVLIMLADLEWRRMIPKRKGGVFGGGS